MHIHNRNCLLTTDLLFEITWRPAMQHFDPENDKISAISDHNNETCLTLGLHYSMDSRILLIGSLFVMYKTLYVAAYTNIRSFTFYGESCANDSSVLMSHVGPEPGSTCHPFCGVPNVCSIKERQDTDSIITTFHFECVCAVQSCSEILLWLWRKPGELVTNVCEIEVLGYNW